MKKDVFLFLLCFVALTVCAQDPVEYNGLWYTLDANNSTATVVANPTGDGYSGEITIPDAVEYGGKSYDVTRVGDEAFCGTNILSVTIGDKLKSIGVRAFAYSSVTSAVIGKGASSGNNSCQINDFAFYECRGLADVFIGDNVSRIGQSAFHHCSCLRSVVIGKGVSRIGASAFFDCEKLKDVYLFLLDGFGGYGWEWGPFFDFDHINSMTLHITEALSDWTKTYWEPEPWFLFKDIKILASTEFEKCATPQITFADGVVSFTCETEGVEFVSHIDVDEAWFFNSLNSSAPLNFTVSVFAVKKGCLRSDTAVDAYSVNGFTHEVKSNAFKDGDVNKDGKVNVGDHVKLSEIIMAKGK